MKKRTAISMPILAIVIFVGCLGAVLVLVVPLFMVGSFASVVVNGPAEYMTSPTLYSQRLISIWEDVDQDNVEIVQLQEIQVPESVWGVIAGYSKENELGTQLISFEDRGEGVLHIYHPLREVSQSDEHLEATLRFYVNDFGRQISVHGELYDETITRVLISTQNFQKEAAIVDGTFLLVSEWTTEEQPTGVMSVIAYATEGEVVTELGLSFEE